MCNYHTNSCDRLKCKKEVSGHGLTSDEARILVKQWLMLGLDISDDAEDGQARHVHDFPLESLFPIGDELALDQRAAELA